MSNSHEPVYLRFRGQMRRLPLMSFAAAFRSDVEASARALDTLLGRSSEPPVVPPPPPDEPPRLDSPLPGEGGKGGGERERSGTFVQYRKERSERERHVPTDERALAHRFATALDDTENFAAVLTLVRMHPESLLDEALRRTLAMPAERLRGTRGALFTGIVRRLARDGWSPPHS